MKFTTVCAMISMFALAIPACTDQAPDEGDEVQGSDDATSEDGSAESVFEGENNVGEAEQAVESCIWHEVFHYGYSVSGAAYRWDISHNLSTGKWYVDQWRVGYRPSTYVQYVLTPDWTPCWSPSYPNENIALKHGGSTMTGIHNCLPDGREEAHLPDQQRVLSRLYPAPTYDFYDIVCL